MNQDNWRRVEELFDELVDRPAPEQQQALDEACANDPDLRREVESLLLHAEGPEGVTEGVGGAARSALHGDSGTHDETLLGQVIDAYEIVELLGSGGFGTVYRAHQKHPVTRDVALKLIRAGAARGAVTERFELERQTLAMMNHPGIAQVYDAGESPQGTPYFVMELVPGEAITSYCDRQGLDLEARIRLFQRVCAAAQHAHQRGIIHRDLKPSNVLVTEVDGDATPKIIDFGIAKALRATDTGDDGGGLTAVHQIVGTPEYMSPEQARFGDSDLDTRSDIYSLGVLLYELLTGQTPLAAATGADASTDEQSSLDEALRQVRELEAPKPSSRAAAATRGTAASPSVGTVRRPDARLRGDLDWITLRALEKDRTRRYASAAALGDDLDRHLRNLPVEAGPPSPWYRWRKFSRRNRVGVTAAAAVLLALVVGLGVASTSLLRAARERDRAIEAEESARQVSTFLIDLFEGVDPQHALGREVSAREILDRAAGRIDALADREPRVALQLGSVLGRVYTNLGLYDQAEFHLDAAAQLRNSFDGLREVTSDDELDLAHLRALQNEPEEALELAHAALERRKTQFGPRSAEAAEAMLEIGRIGFVNSDSALLDVLDECLELRRELFGPRAPEVAEVLHSLAMDHAYHRRFPRAVELLRQALDIYDESYDRLHPKTLTTLSKLVWALANLKEDPDEALELAERSIEDTARSFGTAHPAYAEAIANRGSVHYRALRDGDAALADFRTAADVLADVWHSDHPEVNELRRRQGFALLNLERFDEALDMQFEVLASDLRELGPEHGRTMRQYYNIGVAAQRAGDHETAVDYLYRHVKWKPDNWRTFLNANPMNLTGVSLMELGRYDEAEDLFASSLQLLIDQEGEDFWPNEIHLENLVEVNRRQGQADELAHWQAELDAFHERRAAAEAKTSAQATDSSESPESS